MKTAVVIPARYASTRFPGKPLALIKGKPLIRRVLERVSLCKNVDAIAVATDDKRIYDAVKKMKYGVYMTPKSCKSGTDRIAFAAKEHLRGFDIFINVQGDEPLIDPSLIDSLSKELKKDDYLKYITAAYPIKKEEDLKNSNITKVIFDKKGYAIYFSRSLIPYNKSGAKIKYYKHIGIYGYKKDFLLSFANAKMSILEKAESLEQLRALENGYKIKVITAKKDSIGVDVPSDIGKVSRKLKIECSTTRGQQCRGCQ
ncbi:MAG: 3-deoxy-manno-octulosonate cytidylyltransferase [Endomicrobium sp.]|jgi:3-deoxy-manno-octulosonate cytidylyltransferase (CMP-KDO synthetase)|nr:3-deoxy-manno-octulosonate cytidylyltransferase [Endomicrobium sp.]